MREAAQTRSVPLTRAAAVFIGLALLATSCGSEGQGTATPPSPITDASASPESAEETSALEGEWRTGVMTEADIETTLQEEGLDEHVEDLLDMPDTQPPLPSQVFVLEIGDGRWDLYWEEEGGAAEQLDYDARYEVTGDTVTVSHETDHNVYRWSVEGDTLTLAWLETTYPDYKGIPEQIFQTAFYMSDSFERQG